MKREEALSIWAPERSPWSHWIKAVLFSFMSDEIPDTAPTGGAAWKVPLLKDAALLVEMPGAKGVEVGMSLARSGYCPIPLYNACPYELYATEAEAYPNAFAVIDVVPIMRALERETGNLKVLALPSLAPPAFLLDANRKNAGFSPEVGSFDNRSIIRESDVPSADYLNQNGIRRVIVIRSNRELQTDLQAILLSWQDAGLAIAEQAPEGPWSPVNFIVPRVSSLRLWWNKFLLRFGYRLNSAGSFGRFMHGSGG
jgi:hypothetical protein